MTEIPWVLLWTCAQRVNLDGFPIKIPIAMATAARMKPKTMMTTVTKSLMPMTIVLQVPMVGNSIGPVWLPQILTVTGAAIWTKMTTMMVTRFQIQVMPAHEVQPVGSQTLFRTWMATVAEIWTRTPTMMAMDSLTLTTTVPVEKQAGFQHLKMTGIVMAVRTILKIQTMTKTLCPMRSINVLTHH